ncbi:tetraacyldisaccharide 4'-kinase [Sansalvadorimonas verongulae]|uniref:tetraacyldisaccharide 4'-kinase n=1 Tax=Sansalvadorimonas verongulae TaxID=2172824 RepID=UPI0012BCA9A0|nr:tetraacyldisaccharide 4'-kinase [Sansalvadorimonas verongulae]MTI14679.1 tetraacyldisaccharide 4'-kinase [Sansalvadorimonas verongulae]
MSRFTHALSEKLVQAWYRPELSFALLPLLPLAALVKREASRRYQNFRQFPPWKPPVPVIVVGNVTAGGTGKTPMVAALVKRLVAEGYRPGVISRGYASNKSSSPVLVGVGSDPEQCGDEPVMLAELTGVPVVVDADRQRAVRHLLDVTDCNLVISDDGLQHYRLHRDLEIALVDGTRGLGNGYCLPAGPLRESGDRLRDVDLVVTNGPCQRALPVDPVLMTLKSSQVLPVDGKSRDFTGGSGDAVHAVAGIGNPQRFFSTLEKQGFTVHPHVFPDHHSFVVDDLSSLGDGTVIMTAKDAIKCRPFARDNWWYLTVEAQLPESFWTTVLGRLSNL